MAGGGQRQGQTWALSRGCPVLEARGQRTEGRLDCCEQAQGALCWWQGTCTALKPTRALETLELGFRGWSQGSQKGS